MKHPFHYLMLLSLVAYSCKSTDTLSGITLYESSQKDIRKSIPINSIAHEVSIIPLEQAQAGWSNISNLLETENSFYLIGDDKVVCQYDKTGKYIGQIGALGRGPGEYLYPKSLFVGTDSVLSVFDYNTQKIMKYTLSGTFLTSEEPQKNNMELYLDAFFPISNDSILFYAASNATSIDLLVYEKNSQSLTPISRRNRDMEAGEALMGGVFTFGNPATPSIYNSFNDTVYILKNQKLLPSFLIRMGNYRFQYNELTMETLMSLTQSRIQIQAIAGTTPYVFIFYTVINAEGRKSKKYMGLYNFQTGMYSQNTVITSDNPLISIQANEKIVNGNTPGEILKIGYSGENKELASIIKYKLK